MDRRYLYIGGPVYCLETATDTGLDEKTLRLFAQEICREEAMLGCEGRWYDQLIGRVTNAWIVGDIMYIAGTVDLEHDPSPSTVEKIVKGDCGRFRLEWANLEGEVMLTGVTVCKESAMDAARIEYVDWTTPYIYLGG